jgi:hypothetical protein
VDLTQALVDEFLAAPKVAQRLQKINVAVTRLGLGSLAGEEGDISEVSTSGVEARSFDAADETRTEVEIVRIGGTSASRMSLEPGWRWSECIKPVVGGKPWLPENEAATTRGGSK